MALPEPYQVTIPDFAGPMDLLVFLVRRRELDVAFISVSAIATDYLSWIERVDILDLDNAGDFILLAAILLQLKAFGLLPVDEPEVSDVELSSRRGEPSKEELMALRRSVIKLSELEENQVNLFDRGGIQINGLEEEIASDMLSEVSLYDLAVAFKGLISDLPPEPTHIVEQIPFTIEGQMTFVLSFFEHKRKISFDRLASALESRLAVIMTFLAMLELIRLRKVAVTQPKPFGQLWLELMLVKADA